MNMVISTGGNNHKRPVTNAKRTNLSLVKVQSSNFKIQSWCDCDRYLEELLFLLFSLERIVG